MLVDRFGRKITYLRLSITDRCNLRCFYCSRQSSFSWLAPEEILSYEELFELVKVAVSLGIRKVRITGGEPLVRKGLPEFISRLSALPLEDIALTTNGVLLSTYAPALRKAGLKRLNISLDTLREERYAEICGRPLLSKVMAGLEQAVSLDFELVKINVVALKGYNEDELLDLARLALKWPVEVRFIEFMPVGDGAEWKQAYFLSLEEVKKLLAPLGPLETAEKKGGGPAKVFKFPGAQGRIGFIGSMSEPFCQGCNRLRVTADGRLRPCLFSDWEIDLKNILRRPHTAEDLKEAFQKAVASKPSSRRHHTPHRLMRSIGG